MAIARQDEQVAADLLDLRDDLAAMVVWLAENWSADLPVPTVYGRGGGGVLGAASVELSACTLDPGVLARMAHLLGVVPADDERPNDNGNRYRRASRRFGRVSLLAFTPLATDTEPAP